MAILQKSVFSLLAILIAFQANYVMATQSQPTRYTAPSSNQIVNGKNVIFFASKDKNVGKKINHAFNSPHFENELKQIFQDSKNTFKINDKINFTPILVIAPQDNYAFFLFVKDRNGQIIMKSKGEITSSPEQINPRIEMISIPFETKIKLKPGAYSAEMILVNNNVLSDTIKYAFSLS